MGTNPPGPLRALIFDIASVVVVVVVGYPAT